MAHGLDLDEAENHEMQNSNFLTFGYKMGSVLISTAHSKNSSPCLPRNAGRSPSRERSQNQARAKHDWYYAGTTDQQAETSFLTPWRAARVPSGIGYPLIGSPHRQAVYGMAGATSFASSGTESNRSTCLLSSQESINCVHSFTCNCHSGDGDTRMHWSYCLLRFAHRQNATP